MIIGLITNIAARCDKVVDVLMSCSIDFYARVFVKIRTSAKEKKLVASKSALIYYCQGCKGFVTASVGNVKIDGRSSKFSAGRLPVGRKCSVNTPTTKLMRDL